MDNIASSLNMKSNELIFLLVSSAIIIALIVRKAINVNRQWNMISQQMSVSKRKAIAIWLIQPFLPIINFFAFILKTLFVVLSPILKPILFFVVGVAKILLGIVTAITDLGRSQGSRNEISLFHFAGVIKDFEAQLEQSSKERERVAELICSLAEDPFDDAKMNAAFFTFYYSMLSRKGVDMKILDHPAGMSVVMESVKRVEKIMSNELQRGYDRYLEQQTPF